MNKPRKQSRKSIIADIAYWNARIKSLEDYVAKQRPFYNRVVEDMQIFTASVNRDSLQNKLNAKDYNS